MYGGADERSVRFEWDRRKAIENARKHGVRFLEATSVFDDDRAAVEVQRVNGELRIVLIGRDRQARLLVVVWTKRGDRVRLISARKATARERAEYGEPR